ncbi:uncharacterized protein LOC129913766 [Episyrphus balteatus]|uniref:uncharacterized protein LOC129913766 n=1 Tax=Episyrphus balteatus TaxID=286459 RepID=UPI0024864177|nr:uncharacterized protein LOC129913766 [Episyrphus balteatus]
MSNQCRSCGRDLNNNYIPYANAYATASNSSGDRESSISSAATSYNTRSAASSIGPMGKLSQMANAASQSASAMSSTSVVTQTQLTAKVMFGTVGAIKELREKEKSRQTTARASDRRN